jgi:hypothetical protein
MLVHGVSDDGSTLHVLRGRNDTVETGVLKPLAEGKPITGEVVRLKPRKEFPLLCDVEVDLPAPHAGLETTSEGRAEETSRSGPAQVATATYRKNWDAVYRSRSKRSLVN